MFRPTLSRGSAVRLNEYLGVSIRPVAPWSYVEQSTPYDGHLLDFNPNTLALVYDNHKFFFSLLFRESRHHKTKLVVLHVDRHWDSKLTELAVFRARQGFSDGQDAYKFADRILHEGDFLTAACAANLIEKIIFYIPNVTQTTTKNNLAIFEKLGVNACYCSNFEDVLAMGSKNIVLDLDLDLFLDANGRALYRSHTLRKLFKKNWLAVGIAVSPRHVGGLEPALELWKEEQGYDLFEHIEP